jgi:dolichol-phosphate mannosyltransferase
MNRFLVVIPVFNEEETIAKVVHGAVKFADVLVVDDCSKDKTPEILAGLKRAYPNKFQFIRHEKNTHIPGGIQDGMKFALEKNYEYVITMDAGLSHDPEEIPKFINYPPNDLVIGKRVKTFNVPFYRKIISFFAARVINFCISKNLWNPFGPNLSDCTSGFRRYSKTAYERIAKSKLESVAFDFHIEALYLTYSNGGRVREVGISYLFTNSSFNKKVFLFAWEYAKKLLKRKIGL